MEFKVLRAVGQLAVTLSMTAAAANAMTAVASI
jgi:hypothetical protein